MQFSKFGKKLGQQSGIGILMDDLGRALAEGGKKYMLGAGNPAHIPAVQARFRTIMEGILAEPGAWEKFIGNYDSPAGKVEFLQALAAMLKREFGWPITERNIALTNGSQTAFFILFNLFAGEYEGGKRKKILLPLAPEYIGYTDAGLTPGFFHAEKPEIHLLDDRMFKYYVDFDRLRVTEDVGAICVSRPTNPTGNVLTNEEISRLDAMAQAAGVPLILDNAYGTPFPDIIFTDARPVYNENTIVCMSLSKFGLPSSRTGIVIANERVIRAVTEVNGIVALSPGGMGASLAMELVRTGEIIQISRDIVKPFYKQKADRAVEQLKSELGDLPCRIHKPEGALFLWLWFEGLPCGSQELYERLKARGVIIVPGHHFFPGIEDKGWAHAKECIRVTYATEDAAVRTGLSIIAEEAKKAYAGAAV